MSKRDLTRYIAGRRNWWEQGIRPGSRRTEKLEHEIVRFEIWQRQANSPRLPANLRQAIWTKYKTNEIREKAINMLGGKCIQCGFTDHRALQFDHVNSDGFKDRVNNKLPYRYSRYYRKIIASFNSGEGRFQLLCANCNWIKRTTHNEHVKERRNKQLAYLYEWAANNYSKTGHWEGVSLV